MFSAFIWAQKQVNSVPASVRKSRFKKLTWTKTKQTFSDAHFIKNSQLIVIKQTYNCPAQVQKYQAQYLPGIS